MQVWWYKESGFLLFIIIVNLQVCLFYIPFSISRVFFYVWLCGWSCKSFYLFGNLWKNDCLYFLLTNAYIVPMTSQIFLDSWLVSHLPIFLWFSCLLESVDNVSQFLVLYFCFQFLHFFFLFQFLVLCFFFQFLDGFFFLFCVSLSVFLFPVSVFLFCFLFKFLGCVSISSCWNLFFQFLIFFFLVPVSEFLSLFPVLDFFFLVCDFLFFSFSQFLNFHLDAYPWILVVMAGVGEALIRKLETGFSVHVVMDVLGIMYSYHWL